MPNLLNPYSGYLTPTNGYVSVPGPGFGIRVANAGSYGGGQTNFFPIWGVLDGQELVAIPDSGLVPCEWERSLLLGGTITLPFATWLQGGGGNAGNLQGPLAVIAARTREQALLMNGSSPNAAVDNNGTGLVRLKGPAGADLGATTLGPLIVRVMGSLGEANNNPLYVNTGYHSFNNSPTVGNMWNNVSTGVNGVSTRIGAGAGIIAYYSIFGTASGATTLTLQRSIDGSTFSGDVKNQQVLAGASDFCFEGFSSAGFLRLLSSANVTVTATGAGAA